MRKILFSFLFFPIHILGQSSFFLVNPAVSQQSLLQQENNKSLQPLLYNRIDALCRQTSGVIIDELSDYLLLTDATALQSTASVAGNLPVVKYRMELKLSLAFRNSGKVFRSIGMVREYAGNSERECLEKLINDLNFEPKEVEDFFQSGFSEMKRYYRENCDKIVEHAKQYQNTGDPDKALAICLSVPTDIPCYGAVESLIGQLYTSISYKADYGIFLKAQDEVSKGNYAAAFSTLKQISVYSKFYSKAELLSKQINDFLFKQQELQKQIELADSQTRLRQAESDLQQKRNELQESINRANIEMAEAKNASDREVARQQIASRQEIKAMELQSQREIRIRELQSKERTEMIKSAENVLSSFLNRPQPPRNTNFYVIK